jgi:hypothetical protein
MEFVKDYWQAAVCFIGTYVLFNVVVGVPWWAAILGTVVTWAFALGLCCSAMSGGSDGRV